MSEDENGGFVYVLDEGTDRLKIGAISGKVEERIGSLQTRNSLVYTKQYPTKAEAFAAEAGIHALLSEFKIEGEWFWAQGAAIEWLRSKDSNWTCFTGNLQFLA